MSRIDWSNYVRYFSEIKTQQTPISSIRREQIENQLEDLLQTSGTDQDQALGTAYGFGNDTEVIVRLHTIPDDWLAEQAPTDITRPLAVRIMREGRGNKIISFLKQRSVSLHPLNAPEHRHFQRTVGVIQCDGLEVVLQEWIPGETLEWLQRNHWNDNPLDGARAREIVRQLLYGVVIPAWGAATGRSGVLWDLRGANFVLSNFQESIGSCRLTFVDTWHLRHLTKSVANREGQINMGLRRLRRRIEDILLNQGIWENRPKRFQLEFKEAFESSQLAMHLCELTAQDQTNPEPAREACARFLESVDGRGLFRTVG